MSNKQKPISDIMTRTLCQVSSSQTAIDALARMRSKSVSSVLVVDDAAIRGIITERDIVRAVHNNGNLQTMGCVELMQSPVVSVGPETACLEAYHEMVARGIRHLAITDEAGRVLGLASEGDLLRDFGIEYYMNFKDVGSVMRPDVCMLRETAMVADAVELMVEQHQSCVLVVDAQMHPIGILTERDVVRLCGDHMDAGLLSLGQVMHAPVKTATPHQVLHDAVELMEKARIRRLVVIDEAGVVCGLLTHHEIVRGLEGDYSAYFKQFIEMQSRGRARASSLINEKLMLDTLLRAAGSAAIAADLDYHIRHATPAVAGLLGLDANAILGQELRATLKQTGWPDAADVVYEAILADGARTFEATIGNNHIGLRVLVMRDAQDRSCGFLLLAQRSPSH